MSTETEVQEEPSFGLKRVLTIVAIAVVLTALATFFIVRSYLASDGFRPVKLTQAERQVLDNKMQRLEGNALRSDTEPSRGGNTDTPARATDNMDPEPYDESGASRLLKFTERELNGLIAEDPDMARHIAVDLSDDLLSAKVLVDVPPDMPFFGGRTLRLNAGLELGYSNERPIVALRGLSVMGVPIPNAWLGGIKNVDLVDELGTDSGPWKLFADGVAELKVNEGQLTIQLKE